MKSFKSKLKVVYLSEIGQWAVTGESLTRKIHSGHFYDKKAAISFKHQIDEQDFYFYHDNLN
jgi:hypothetical protein